MTAPTVSGSPTCDEPPPPGSTPTGPSIPPCPTGTDPYPTPSDSTTTAAPTGSPIHPAPSSSIGPPYSTSRYSDSANPPAGQTTRPAVTHQVVVSTQTATPTGGLAYTGAGHVEPLTAAGLLIVLAGGVALAAGRRRRGGHT